jgi:hypothetical protein
MTKQYQQAVPAGNDQTMTLSSVARALSKKVRFIMGVASVAALIVLAWAASSTKMYKAEAVIAPSQVATATVLLRVAQSDAVRDKVVASLDLARHYGTTSGLETSLVFSARVKFKVGMDNLLLVVVTDSDKEFAARGANTLAQEIIRAVHDSRLSQSGQNRYLIEQRRDAIKRNVLRVEERLSKLGAGQWERLLSPATRALMVSLSNLRAELALRETSSDSAQSAVLAMVQQQAATIRGDVSAARSAEGATTTDLLESVGDLLYFRAVDKRLEREQELNEGKERMEIRVLAPAALPIRKDGPSSILLALAAFLLGFVAASAYVLIGESRRMNTP